MGVNQKAYYFLQVIDSNYHRYSYGEENLMGLCHKGVILNYEKNDIA